MRQKRKMILLWLASIFVAIAVTAMAFAIMLRPSVLEIGSIDVSQVADGTYIGICQNKILFGVVQVEVRDNEIIDIQVLEHKASYMEQAEQMAGLVVQEQSLEVDAISGATLTSDTILKAIEHALEQSTNEKSQE